MTTPIPLKIAYIGGGSRDWARKLMIDLALCPDLTGEVALYDIDEGALRVARRNMKAFKITLICRKSNLLERAVPADVILANLPYVPERYAINRAAEHEPGHAIFGGKDGLNVYRRLWEQIAGQAEKPLFVLTESLPPQHQDLAVLAKAAGYTLHAAEDFIQVFKRA